MAFHLYEDVLETTTTTGTGDLILAGAVTGYRAFSSQYANADTLFYSVYDGTNFEHGIGTYNSGANSITRTTVLRSTNSNAAVNFPTGSKNIGCAPLGVAMESLVTPASTGSPRKTGNATWAFDAAGQFANTTATNDNASAGNLGEYQTATSGSAVTLTSGGAVALVSLTLTAGDWEVGGSVQINVPSFTSSYSISLSTTNAGAYAWPADGASLLIPNGTLPVNTTGAFFIGAQRQSLSGATTIYMNVTRSAAGNTHTASGFIRARRVR